MTQELWEGISPFLKVDHASYAQGLTPQFVVDEIRFAEPDLFDRLAQVKCDQVSQFEDSQSEDSNTSIFDPTTLNEMIVQAQKKKEEKYIDQIDQIDFNEAEVEPPSTVIVSSRKINMHPAKNAEATLYGQLKKINDEFGYRLPKRVSDAVGRIFRKKKINQSIIKNLLHHREFQELVLEHFEQQYTAHQEKYVRAHWTVEQMVRVIRNPDMSEPWWSTATL